MTTPNTSKHRRSAARARRIDAAEPMEAARAAAPPAGKAPRSEAAARTTRLTATRRAASAFKARKRVILNLLRAVGAGRFESSRGLGAWGEALLAARLICETPWGVDLTGAGRAMLAEMSRKHGASAEAPVRRGPAASSMRPIDRGGAPSRAERDSTLASS